MRATKLTPMQPSRTTLVAFLVQPGLCAGQWVCAAGLTRVAALVKARAPVGRSLRSCGAGLLRAWRSAARTLPSRPMPPFSVQHSLRMWRAGVPAWLALASRAAYNRSVKADRVLARCACQRASAYVQR